jgi:hypothetical protein
MQDMLFGDKPSFDEVMYSLRQLERQINGWYKHQIVDNDGLSWIPLSSKV